MPGPSQDLTWPRPAVSPCLALLGLPRLASASLALPAPRNNSPAAFGGRAARSAAAVVAGAGKASEADARRGEPSKARPGAYNPCVWRLAHLETFSEKCTLKKKRHFWNVFERNPLLGSDSARHLEPDALILVRFGAMRGQISHNIFFSENMGALF